jgi:two-component system, cell cycle response regulator DivK
MTHRIVVVDDNHMNLELVTFLLEATGCVVETAPDASAARKQIHAQQPDLILMDIQMPGLDGLSFTKELKADAAFRHIPVLAFTAYAMKGDEARILAAGCDGYIAKPIDVATFVHQVRAHLPGLPH